MVLVSRAEKRAIFTYLLKEGVIVVRKDSYLPTHQDIDCPNLKVMMTVKSLVSKGYLAQVFNWQWNYYTVTSKGVTFLAKALGKFTQPSRHFIHYSVANLIWFKLQAFPALSCPPPSSRRRPSLLLPPRVPTVRMRSPPPLMAPLRRPPPAWEEAAAEPKGCSTEELTVVGNF
ncbi:MAG: hypothetical protein GY849_20020 [Deltaproteobacteria bacterium]|nr:hypothetical protein [Deltaproteobacteria bacterium]